MIYGIKTNDNYHEVEANSFCTDGDMISFYSDDEFVFGFNKNIIEYIEVLEEA